MKPLLALPTCVDDSVEILVYMMKVIGCPPQKIKIMAGQKDYDDIWSRAWKQMYNVEPEDKAKWKDFP